MNIAIVGGHKCSKENQAIAHELGKLIAQEGWNLICGGTSGIMEAACQGAQENKGRTIGILPSYNGEEANPYLDVKIPTGLGYARNILVVRAADTIVAIEGKYGTLSEIGFALSEDKKVYGINTWGIDGVIKVKGAEEVIKRIKEDVK